jgi:hypothetical protein
MNVGEQTNDSFADDDGRQEPTHREDKPERTGPTQRRMQPSYDLATIGF